MRGRTCGRRGWRRSIGWNRRRAWRCSHACGAWHAKAEIDDFTDAVGARVSADESRTAVGLGLRAEMEQSESLLYGSLDVERLVAGEETVTAVSQGRLASESERTRVLVGAGGLWQSQRVNLAGWAAASRPGRQEPRGVRLGLARREFLDLHWQETDILAMYTKKRLLPIVGWD